MAERRPVLFRPNDDDWALLEDAMSFRGTTIATEAIRSALRADAREIALLREAHKAALAEARKAKSSSRR